MTKKISIVSNASCNDLYRIRYVFPHWANVFSRESVDEILIAFDPKSVSGRIAKLHGQSFSEELIRAELDGLKALDDRFRVMDLDYSTVDSVGLKWFGQKGLIRCQGGTPIFAFFYAIEQAKNSTIIKLDSDMIFCNRGIENAVMQSGVGESAVIVSLPRFGESDRAFSTRAYAIDKERIKAVLPFRGMRVDPLRYIHRKLKGLPPYRAPELTIEKEIRSGRLVHVALDEQHGLSLHVSLAWWPGLKHFSKWVSSFEARHIPEKQQGWDFIPSAWESGS